MAGIYIPDMEMPVGHNESSFGIDADGHPLLAVYTEKNTEPKIYYIIPVPDHGRLGDLDALADKCDAPYWCVWLSDIDDAPTVIPSDKEDR